MRDDGLVEAIAADAHGVGVHHPVQGNNGDLRGAAADIHHHGTGGLLHRQPRADGGSHRLLDQSHFTGAGTERRLADRAPLHLGGFAGHADQHARAGADKAVLVHFGNEMLQHFLGDLEIGDHAVFQRPDGGDIAGRAAQHAFGVGAHRLDGLLAVMHANGHHRRLIQHNALLADVNQGIGRTQVNRQIVREQASYFFQHLLGLPRQCQPLDPDSGSGDLSWR